PNGATGNRNQSRTDLDIGGPQPDPLGPVLIGPWTEKRLVQTWDDMLSACNGIWVRVGLESVLGHSFQIGNMTELLLQGISPDIVAAQG
ncbi:hypothetical protein L208DRAFT_1346960, partial [Tricholoma matsutake]